MKTSTALKVRLVVLLLVLPLFRSSAQLVHPIRLAKATDSGGSLLREQAAYDVKFYRLRFTIDTTKHSIAGVTLIRAIATDTLSTFVLDLNAPFTVDSIVWKSQRQYGTKLTYSRPAGRIWITMPYVAQKNDTICVEVTYHGVPKVSTNPPWDDGFVWKHANTGEVWAGVACEEEGADVWWPCKDHPSDEPDSVDLYFTVPASLTCVSNGRLLEVLDNGSTKTFHWYVSEPINNYCVTFYLGPYVRIPIDYQSVTGQTIPSEYWFLPYNVDKAKQFAPTFLKDLRFFEEVCGPFPFRSEKYGLADAPYWGMEHQSIIAYGNNFALNSYGFDYIHLHELAHEWWGNLVTAKDWSDVWLHEGFATYMEALFVENMSGSSRYKSYMAAMKGSIQNKTPVAPAQATGAATMFASNDVYYKGAWILHTLRHSLGDSLFFRLFRRFAYPDPAMESVTNGQQCRLATTDDYLQIAEQVTGMHLDWFFNLYLRQPALPKLQYSKQDTTLRLKWVTPNNLPFSLPVDVQVGTSVIRVPMTNGSGSISVPAGTSYQLDPNSWILMSTPQLALVEDQALPTTFDVSVYPNPFNPATTLQLSVPSRARVRGEVVSIAGQRVAELFDSWFEAGVHSIPLALGVQSSGVYFVIVQSGPNQLVRKLVLLK
ncbi:MAG TPA: M1 family aminopeptidase [Bacteroidota bacterium]|nr:M1 family aminopeptidase [Bacteroidota bacterium]